MGTRTDLHVIGVKHLGNAFAKRAAGGRVEQPNDVRVGFIPDGLLRRRVDFGWNPGAVGLRGRSDDDSGAEAAEDELAPLEHGLGCVDTLEDVCMVVGH